MSWSIEGKQVLVTGGTSGIGHATATELAQMGALVTITSRSEESATANAIDIERRTGGTVRPGTLDLSSLASIRSFAERFAADHDRLDVLINNAGTMSGRRRTTTDGLEWTLAVNHLGPFLLTNLLVDLLVAGAPSRVLTVSSEVHRNASQGLDFDDLQMTSGYGASKAYATSKLANILFTTELDRRLSERGVTARALHPGVVATNFGKGPGGSRWMGLAMSLLSPFLKTPTQGAATSVHLATAQPTALEAGIYWSDREPKQPSDAALDRDAAVRLWEASTVLVGLA